MCYGRANKVGHPYCPNNSKYLCQHSHDHPHDLVICKAVSFIEVLFHVLYFTFARVVPSPWDGSPSPGVLNSSFKFKEGFRLTPFQSLFVLTLSQIASAHLKTGHMGSSKSFPPCSNEENHGAEVESSKQFAQDDPPSLWRAGPGSLS